MSDDRSVNADFNIKPGADTARTLLQLEEAARLTKAIGDNAATSTNNLLRMESAASQAVVPGGGGGDGGGGGGVRGAGSSSKNVRGLNQAVRVLGAEAGGAASEVTGMISTVVQFGQSMGPVGIAVGAALVGVTIAMNEMKKVGEEEARQVDIQRKAHEAYVDALSLTSDEIENQIALNDELIKSNQEKIAFEQDIIDKEKSKPKSDLEKIGDLGLQSITGAAGFLAAEITGTEIEISTLTDAIGVTGQVSKEASENVDELTESSEQAAAENERLAEAINSVEVAANDARKALLESVDAEAELAQFRNKALENTAEQNAALAKSIEQERAIKQKQIDTLKASGDTDAEVTDRIEELNGELDELNAQTEVLNSSAVKASEALKAQAEATEDATKAANEQAKALAAASKEVNAAQTKQTASMRQFIVDSANVNNEFTELQVERSRKLIELASKAAEEERQIQEDLDDDKEKLAKNQSFLALFDLEDGIGKEQSKREKARAERFAELKSELDRELEERKIAREVGEQEKLLQIQNEAKITGDAIANEQKMLRAASEDNLRIIESRKKREIQSYQQIGQAVTQILGNVTQFASQSANRVDSLLAGAGGGLGGIGAPGGSIEDQINAALLETLT